MNLLINGFQVIVPPSTWQAGIVEFYWMLGIHLRVVDVFLFQNVLCNSFRDTIWFLHINVSSHPWLSTPITRNTPNNSKQMKWFRIITAYYQCLELFVCRSWRFTVRLQVSAFRKTGDALIVVRLLSNLPSVNSHQPRNGDLLTMTLKPEYFQMRSHKWISLYCVANLI